MITVHGHGGSGPTRLRPRPERGATGRRADGMREPGASVPPELLPEVSAGIRVVCVDGDGLVQPPGELAPGLNVTPSALPRLQATADGGLVVGYRVHRQLPLMTYYWEAAVQVLGPDGWRPPTTFSGTDATLRGAVAGRRRRRGRAGHPGRRAAGPAPCTGRRASAAGSARTWPTTTAR